jgi:hypothetical protein
VFRSRIQVELHVAHVLAAVGEKLYLLHALGLEQLKKPALGFFIVGLHPGKAPGGQFPFALLVPFKRQEVLAGNHFERPLLVPPADVAAVNADRQRPIGSRKLVPAVLAALNETEPFVAQFPLQPFGNLRHVLAKSKSVDGFVDRQHPLQELRRHAVTHERSPLGLKQKQLR